MNAVEAETPVTVAVGQEAAPDWYKDAIIY